MGTEYTVEYIKDNGKQKVFDIMNRLEVFVFVARTLFNHKIRHVRIQEVLIFEEMPDYEESS